MEKTLSPAWDMVIALKDNNTGFICSSAKRETYFIICLSQ